MDEEDVLVIFGICKLLVFLGGVYAAAHFILKYW